MDPLDRKVNRHRGAFAALLRALRAAANLTQEELAERAGLSAQAIGALERGRRKPRASTLGYLVEALRLDEERRANLIAAAHVLRASQPAEPLAPGDLADRLDLLVDELDAVAAAIGRERDRIRDLRAEVTRVEAERDQ